MHPNDHQTNSSELLHAYSRQDFLRAHRKSFWRSVISWLGKTDNDLLPFDEVMKRVPLKGQSYFGLKQIETDKIVGSVSRYLEFDRAFLPRQTHTRERWERIDQAYYSDVILPPIDVYQIGDVYFVKDGNHRVSVARERGQMYMDAFVVKINIPGTMDKNTNLEQLVLQQEYLGFITQTHLDEIAPKENFRFSIPGQYDKLMNHISVHRWFMGEKLQRPVTDQEAVAGWLQDVYHPLIRIIRKYDILKEFPLQTEMDLYLWIIEHRWYMVEEQHRKISLDAAARHYASHFSRKPFRHLRQFYLWIVKKTKKLLKKNQP
jgi:hypothetical protein